MCSADGSVSSFPPPKLSAVRAQAPLSQLTPRVGKDGLGANHGGRWSPGEAPGPAQGSGKTSEQRTSTCHAQRKFQILCLKPIPLTIFPHSSLSLTSSPLNGPSVLRIVQAKTLVLSRALYAPIHFSPLTMPCEPHLLCFQKTARIRPPFSACTFSSLLRATTFAHLDHCRSLPTGLSMPLSHPYSHTAV